MFENSSFTNKISNDSGEQSGDTSSFNDQQTKEIGQLAYSLGELESFKNAAEVVNANELIRKIRKLEVKIPSSANESAHYLEGHALSFENDEAQNLFESELLENAHPTAVGNFGGACWRQFEKEHPDWSDKDYESACFYSWCGGGFYTLPTVEFLEGGTCLFCSEKQYKLIEGENAPWICKATSQDKNIYVGIDDIDSVTVLRDDVVNKIEQEAAEMMKANNGKLFAQDGWEVPLDSNQKPMES